MPKDANPESRDSVSLPERPTIIDEIQEHQLVGMSPCGDRIHQPMTGSGDATTATRATSPDGPGTGTDRSTTATQATSDVQGTDRSRDGPDSRFVSHFTSSLISAKLFEFISSVSSTDDLSATHERHGEPSTCNVVSNRKRAHDGNAIGAGDEATEQEVVTSDHDTPTSSLPSPTLAHTRSRRRVSYNRHEVAIEPPMFDESRVPDVPRWPPVTSALLNIPGDVDKNAVPRQDGLVHADGSTYNYKGDETHAVPPDNLVDTSSALCNPVMTFQPATRDLVLHDPHAERSVQGIDDIINPVAWCAVLPQRNNTYRTSHVQQHMRVPHALNAVPPLSTRPASVRPVPTDELHVGVTLCVQAVTPRSSNVEPPRLASTDATSQRGIYAHEPAHAWQPREHHAYFVWSTVTTSWVEQQ